jgi:hypothetical protein
LAALRIDDKIAPITTAITGTESLFNNNFVPYQLANARYAQAYADAVAAGAVNAGSPCVEGPPNTPSETCFKAHEAAQDLWNKFYHLMDNATALAWNATISAALKPSFLSLTGETLIDAYLHYLATSSTSGFLTNYDSVKAREIFIYFHTFEAEASWMKVSYFSQYYEKQPDGVALLKKLEDTEIIGYANAEVAALPPAIPVGVVVATPATVALRVNNTVGSSMFVYQPSALNLAYRSPADMLPGLVGVDRQLQIYNTTDLGAGFKDWHVPTLANPPGSTSDFYNLFNGRAAALKLTAPNATLAHVIAAVDAHGDSPDYRQPLMAKATRLWVGNVVLPTQTHYTCYDYAKADTYNVTPPPPGWHEALNLTDDATGFNASTAASIWPARVSYPDLTVNSAGTSTGQACTTAYFDWQAHTGAVLLAARTSDVNYIGPQPNPSPPKP